MVIGLRKTAGNYFTKSMLAHFITLDHRIFWLINAHHTPFFDGFFSIVTNLGNGWFLTPILLTIVLLKIPRNRQIVCIIVGTIFMVASGLTNSSIKQSYNRLRPPNYFSHGFAGDTQAGRKVHVVGERLCCNSFPSGHSNTAFSGATLVAIALGGPYWLSFVAAGIVGYSRVYLGVHFPSDVIGGGLLGIIIMCIGMTLYAWYDRRGQKNRAQQ